MHISYERKNRARTAQARIYKHVRINDIKAVYLLFNKAYLMFLALREMVRAVREGSCGSCMVRAVRKLHLWFVRLFLRTKSPLEVP